MMPQSWLVRHLPDPQALLARPVDTRAGWAAPLPTWPATTCDWIERIAGAGGGFAMPEGRRPGGLLSMGRPQAWLID
jgi:hypothetical protein